MASKKSRTVTPVDAPTRQFNYLGLENISPGQWDEPQENIVPGSAVRSACVVFAPGQVLYGKLRPYLNKVVLCSRQGIATTELVPLAVARDAISPDYLAAFLRSRWFVDYASSHTTGSRMPRVALDDFWAAPIPLPPLPDQRRIVGKIDALFDRIREAKRLQAEAVSQASQLVEAALAEVFADESRWERCDLGDLIAIEAKAVDPTLPRHRRLPHINGTLIEPVTGELGECRTADEDGMTSVKYLFSPGEVLYSKIRPYLRKAALVEFAGLCSADIYPLRVVDANKLLPEFLRWTLVSEPFTRYANNLSQRARMPKLNRQQLFAYKMGLPSIADQRTIVDHLTRVRSLSSSLATAQQATAAGLDRLEQSVLDMAFRGEL